MDPLTSSVVPRPASGALENLEHFTVVAEGFPRRGATEKDLIEDPATGQQYVAKLGRRNNDLEVATEYVIYLLGRNLGATTADARIGVFRGRLRFLSGYFLDARHQLAHGVELFRELVDNVDDVLEDAAREQTFFTVQAVRDALGAHYVQRADELFGDFLRMLVHDAVIGVQDRHHENWGVITSREVAEPVRFAPLYDSARGLFGNMEDDQLRRRFASPAGSAALDKYVDESRPLIGFAGTAPANGRFLTHVELARHLFWGYPQVRTTFSEMLGRYDWKAFDAELSRMGRLVSPFRRSMILTCVRRRIRRIWWAISQGPKQPISTAHGSP